MLHSNKCCVEHEPAFYEDLDLHIAIFIYLLHQEKFNAFVIFILWYVGNQQTVGLQYNIDIDPFQIWVFNPYIAYFWQFLKKIVKKL